MFIISSRMYLKCVQNASILSACVNILLIAADDEVIRAESLQFDFATVRVATNNFSDANKLGQGGFGAVYKVKSSTD